MYVFGYKDRCPEGFMCIYTTSKSKDFGKGLSPFFVGGNIALYGGFTAKNVENVW